MSLFTASVEIYQIARTLKDHPVPIDAEPAQLGYAEIAKRHLRARLLEAKLSAEGSLRGTDYQIIHRGEGVNRTYKARMRQGSGWIDYGAFDFLTTHQGILVAWQSKTDRDASRLFTERAVDKVAQCLQGVWGGHIGFVYYLPADRIRMSSESQRRFRDMGGLIASH